MIQLLETQNHKHEKKHHRIRDVAARFAVVGQGPNHDSPMELRESGNFQLRSESGSKPE
jgi:hypothetical protein